MWELTERQNAIQEITENDPRFREDAYNFILDTLRDVIENLEEVRHVTGRELSEGCRNRQSSNTDRLQDQYWSTGNQQNSGFWRNCLQPDKSKPTQQNR